MLHPFPSQRKNGISSSTEKQHQNSHSACEKPLHQQHHLDDHIFIRDIFPPTECLMTNTAHCIDAAQNNARKRFAVAPKKANGKCMLRNACNAVIQDGKSRFRV